jgi:acetylornithine deacetylase/succinyl-diaminopimelate desuccinylase-like protein
MHKTPIYDQPVQLLQNLIRFDTTNPPGNEDDCIQYINLLISEAGISTTILGRTPQRSNLIARIKGQGNAAPLLLYGHVDVVTTANQNWTHPPFAAEIADGYIWGRGALDMKSGVTMLLAAFLKAKTEGVNLPGDIIFCAVADEENSGAFGARFLVEEHAQLFQDVRYAFGEFGGFNLNMAGKRIYPIMVAEKQICAIVLTFQGRGGHGSMPIQGGAMAKAARALRLLDKHRLPYHLTAPAKMMINGISAAIGGLPGMVLAQAVNPLLADGILKLLGDNAEAFSPILHNTVSPTMLTASDKLNVIPSEVSIGLDGRLLPGFKPQDLQKELRHLLGDDFKMEVLEYDPGPETSDMGLFDSLGSTLRSLDPTGTAVPLVLSGVTDARFFSKLGIQTYGFTPLKLPDDFNFIRTIHTADERVPVDALEFGLQAIFKAIQAAR